MVALSCERVLRPLTLTLALAIPAASLAQLQGPFALPDDHFLCYKGRTSQGDLALPTGLQVNLTDQIEADRDYDIRKVRGICNPANKNGEGITDLVTHVAPYRIKRASDEPKHVPATGIRVFNQFGDLIVDTIREDRILVPAAMSSTGGPVVEPDDALHAVDHYKCYKIRVSPGTGKFPKGMQASVEDEFETPAKLYKIGKPKLLCTPVDKNGEGIKNPDGHLLCYRAKPAPGEPRHVKRLGVSTADQFVVHKIDTRKEDVLCVPSLKDPPAEFCGDGEVNQAPLEECDGDPSTCPPGQSCTPSCTCIAALGQRVFSLDPANSAFFTGFLGEVPVATPMGTLVLNAGALDGSSAAPVSLAAAPAYVTTTVALGAPQTICQQFLSCSGTIHCAGGANVDVLEVLDSLSASQPTCVQDGTNSCPNDPSSLCCSNSCEGVGVGSGNVSVVTVGVGAGDSGAGAMAITCQTRTLNNLPVGAICPLQDYSGAPIETHGFTTGEASSELPQHCAGTGAPPDVTPAFGSTGANFDCGSWTVENGPGTLVFSLAVEEATSLITGDSSNVFVYGD